MSVLALGLAWAWALVSALGGIRLGGWRRTSLSLSISMCSSSSSTPSITNIPNSTTSTNISNSNTSTSTSNSSRRWCRWAGRSRETRVRVATCGSTSSIRRLVTALACRRLLRSSCLSALSCDPLLALRTPTRLDIRGPRSLVPFVPYRHAAMLALRYLSLFVPVLPSFLSLLLRLLHQPYIPMPLLSLAEDPIYPHVSSAHLPACGHLFLPHTSLLPTSLSLSYLSPFPSPPSHPHPLSFGPLVLSRATTKDT